MLAALVFLIVSALREAGAPPAVPAPAPSNWAVDFPKRVERVSAALVQVPFPLPTPVVASQGAGKVRWLLRRYEVTVPKPPLSPSLAELFAPVRAAAPGVTVGVAEGVHGATVQIGVDGLLTHIVALHWLQHRSQLAIIVDDLGGNLLIARAFSEIEAPLAFAVTPFTPFAQEVAALAALFNREVLLRAVRPGGAGEGGGAPAPASGGRAAFVRWFGNNMALLPQAIGLYGCFGLPTAPDPEALRWLLAEAKAKRLFVVEAGGSAAHTPCDVAASMQVACAADVVVVEAGNDEEALRRELASVLELARTRGQLIAVVPPLPSTVTVLQSVLPSVAASGIDLVPVSTIIKQAEKMTELHNGRLSTAAGQKR